MTDLRLAFATLALALAAALPAHADDADIIALHEESVQAWSEGRQEDADRAAEAAWRMASEEWGASQDTAFLAEALIQQRLVTGRRAAAQAPARQLVDLVEDGAAPAFSPAEARLALELASFDLEAAIADPESPAAGAQLAELIAALEAAEAANLGGNRYVWMGWLDVARVRNQAGDWETAYRAGDRVINLMNLTADVPDSARVEAGVLAGIAAMNDESFDNAYEAFTWAFELTPQYLETANGMEVNRSWATLGVWQSIAAIAHRLRTGEDASPVADRFGLAAAPVAPGLESECQGRWQRPAAPQYPSRAAQDRVSGAVAVQFDIDAEGDVQDLEVLAEAPEGYGFGNAALRAANGWSLDPDTLEGCDGAKLHTFFHFIMQN